MLVRTDKRNRAGRVASPPLEETRLLTFPPFPCAGALRIDAAPGRGDRVALVCASPNTYIFAR